MSELALGGPRCPVCATAFTIRADCEEGHHSCEEGHHSSEDGVVSCERCETLHHKECWDYAGGCALFGCRPGKGVLAKAQTDLLASTLEWWMGAYRFYSSCLLGTSLTISLYVVFWLLLSALTGDFVTPMNVQGSGLFYFYKLAFSFLYLFLIVCGLGMAGSLLPALYARWRIDGLLDEKFVGGRSLDRAVLDRLELSGLGGLVLSVFGPRLWILSFFVYLGWFALLLLTVGITTSGFLFGDVVLALSFTAIILGFLIAWPLRAACAHLAFLSTVQNRALVSFKGKV